MQNNSNTIKCTRFANYRLVFGNKHGAQGKSSGSRRIAFSIPLSLTCTSALLSIWSLITNRRQLKEQRRWKKNTRSSMNQNLSGSNFQRHVFPCNSGAFRGTVLITIFYSSNICMLLQQPVKLHKWEGKKKRRRRKMKKDDGTARCSLFICWLTCRWLPGPSS